MRQDNDLEEPDSPFPSERSPLVGEEAHARATGSRKRPFYVAAGAALVFGAALIGRASVQVVPKQTAILDSQESALKFSVGNEYGSAVPGDGLYPWKYIAEPHKLSTLTSVEPPDAVDTDAALLSEIGADLASSGPTYQWQVVSPEAGAASVEAWGSSLEHKFTTVRPPPPSFPAAGRLKYRSEGGAAGLRSRFVCCVSLTFARFSPLRTCFPPQVGVHTVRLARFVGSTQTHATEATVAVKYVKRELRTLTEADRTAFLDALEVVFKTPTEAGVEKYGSNYMGAELLVKNHLDGAGRAECDHWHDDAGIMTHHLGFTMQMELSLQAVNAAVTIPYWEYTIDAAELGDGWRESKIFSEDWFGATGASLGSSHHVTAGRWADLAIMADAESFSDVVNAYGQLRAPWNLNNEAFVTRSATTVGSSYMGGALPTCDAIKSCFDSASVADMNLCLNGQTHGPVHVLVGGQWGVDLGDLASKVIGSAHLLLFKDLWRRGFARCPTTKAEAEAGGTCSCSAERVEAAGGAYEVLSTKSGAMHWMAESSQGRLVYDSTSGRFTMPGKTTAEEEVAWKDLLEKLCDPGEVGEMYSSSAPYDPLFWVLHTTSERLLQYRRLRAIASEAYPKKLGFDETWGYTHSGADSDLGMVCDWTDVKSDTDMPSCVKGTCDGHHSKDVLPFDLSAVSAALSKSTTNIEFYDFLSPTNPDLPYVYDSFKYEHCESLSINIGDGIEDDDDGPPPTGGPLGTDSAGM